MIGKVVGVATVREVVVTKENIEELTQILSYNCLYGSANYSISDFRINFTGNIVANYAEVGDTIRIVVANDRIVQLDVIPYKIEIPDFMDFAVTHLIIGSKEQSVFCVDNGEKHPNGEYGGAHHYTFKNCTGFADGKTQYIDSEHELRFLYKSPDEMVPGVTNEQVMVAMIDRLHKINEAFYSEDTTEATLHIKAALDCFGRRVQERIDRGVAGELKK